MKNYYKIILSLTILSLMSVGWGQIQYTYFPINPQMGTDIEDDINEEKAIINTSNLLPFLER